MAPFSAAFRSSGGRWIACAAQSKGHRSVKNLSRFKLPRSAIPVDLLARVRLLLLLLVLLFSLLAVPSLALLSEQPWPARLLALGSLVWLAWRWIDWYRSERRLPIELAIETLAITLVTGSVQTLPDALPVVYTGLSYRSLFSSVRQAYLGLLCYSLAFTAGAMVLRPEPGLFAREIVIQFPGFAVVTAVAYHVAEMLRHQRRLAAELEAAEHRYRMLVEHAPVVTYLADTEGIISYMNPQVTTLLGYAPAECLGDCTAFLARVVHPDDRERVIRDTARALRSGRPFTAECRMIRRTGDLVWVRIEARLIREARSGHAYWLGTIFDETGPERLAQELVHQAFHDPLTGLPNRALLLDRLEQALARRRRRPGKVAVLFLDLDNFKVINDTLGHRAGDQLLQLVAQRLTTVVRPSDTIARLGGDEFVVLLDDLHEEDEACRVSMRILEQIGMPIELAGQPVYVTTSIGIALTDDPWLHPDELIRRADLAMYEAKRLGRDRYMLFDSSMEALAWRRLEIECGLRQAIEQRELRVHFQPVVDLRSGALREVEALVRWPHSEWGMLQPDEFLPIAEESGLILLIDRLVLEEACRQLRDWQLKYPANRNLVVSVNLSTKQLREPGMLESVTSVLDRTGLQPGHLRIEISERAVTWDLATALDQLHALRALGIRLALDDFGSGHAAIAALRRLPIDTLKVDRSLVGALGGSERDTTLVQAVISLAKILGLTVTAEGIETPEQAKQLRAFGCDFGQGAYLGGPVPTEEFTRFLSNDFSRLLHTQ